MSATGGTHLDVAFPGRRALFFGAGREHRVSAGEMRIKGAKYFHKQVAAWSYPDLRAPATAEAVLAAVERVRAGAKNRDAGNA